MTINLTYLFTSIRFCFYCLSVCLFGLRCFPYSAFLVRLFLVHEVRLFLVVYDVDILFLLIFVNAKQFEQQLAYKCLILLANAVQDVSSPYSKVHVYMFRFTFKYIQYSLNRILSLMGNLKQRISVCRM